MRGSEIRQKFLDFFALRGHQIVPSSSLVPRGDPTLLFTNAGMVQFKDVFRGVETRPYRRAVTAQKVVRAGGKHNDLDNVGRTARHQTFFEMLGNFSFGDYFKREAISYAWELLTEGYGLPKDKLYATIYTEDDEAERLWLELTTIPRERIIRLGAKDNFWSMGDTGPCGPCSEIVIDRGERYRCGAPNCAVGVCDCDRWLEIWNLVFMQFDRDASGALTPLPRPSIDTGMGLERLAMVLQDVASGYDTDLLRGIVDFVAEISGTPYDSGEAGFPHRVIADHTRSIAFLICDGVLPSNEGRGYVLRRILRRAARFGRKLGFTEPFLTRVSGAVIEQLGDAYNELRDRQEFVARVVAIEEEKFDRTLTNGLALLEDAIGRARASGASSLSGDEAFRLYDTYGFPFELTEEIADEAGFAVDRTGYDTSMARQRAMARAAGRAGAESGTIDALRGLGAPETTFVGYEELRSRSLVVGIVGPEGAVERAEAGSQVDIVSLATPFYAESGGQVGDTGTIESATGLATVTDTRRLVPELIVHHARIDSGVIEIGAEAVLTVDAERRRDTMAHHSATHLLHRALRDILGAHVHQAGSLVAPDRLRFDFSHIAPIPHDELVAIERHVNSAIRHDIHRVTDETTYDDAVKRGAMALFGEKYGDIVRMVSFGDHSRELCGGCHVGSTGEIGIAIVVSETSVAAGVRRIEMLAGRAAEEYARARLAELDRIAGLLRSNDVSGRIEALLSESDAQRREIERLRRERGAAAADDLIARAVVVDGVRILGARIDDADVAGLRHLGDILRSRLGPSIVALGSGSDGKATIVVMATQGGPVNAGTVAARLGELVGGRGGGRPDNGQAGGPRVSELDGALASLGDIVRQYVGR
ncbi:MAG: alanine--tRNA ligase [Chloroflexota bacterium]|nr:MAG: alanine--tRNA ligase [Chloroflexota bacterium]